MSNPKVDFIGIGAQKSATSWLHDVLSEHAEIFASEPKELNFFTANYDRGQNWYESHFPDKRAGYVCGECSPTYFFSSDAPKRAQQYNPDLRLIAVLRDPVARTFSNHLHELRKGHIPFDTPFEKALSENPAYIEQSQYRKNLSHWMEYFTRDKLLVLLAEDIAKDPEKTFKMVCNHLGVDASIVPDGLNERRHESVANRSEGVQNKLHSMGNFARSIGLGAVIKQAKEMQPLRGLLALNKKDLRAEVPKMKQETREYLTELFQPDVKYVADLINRSELPWPTLHGQQLAKGGTDYELS